jgi:putative (di)nucleoside polyphosphate hydrolase
MRTIKTIDNLPYRPGVGIMIINQRKEVFVGKRIDARGNAWQMPQGGIDENETAAEAAKREMLEETGSNNAVILAESKEWFHYDLPPNLVYKLWGGRYRGQKQKWFLLKFLGHDSEFDVNTSHPEFTSWRWAHLHDLLSIIVPFKRKLYEEVVKEFIPIIDQDKNCHPQ